MLQKVALMRLLVKRQPRITPAMINAAQIRAARALLNVNQVELAELARISVATVKRIEAASEVRGAAEPSGKFRPRSKPRGGIHCGR